MTNHNYVELSIKDVEHLLVTATDLETVATHQIIKPLHGKEKIIKFLMVI